MARVGRAIFDGWHGIGDMLTCWQPNRMRMPAKDTGTPGHPAPGHPGRGGLPLMSSTHITAPRTMGQLGRTQWERAFRLAANNDRGFQVSDWKLFALSVSRGDLFY